MIKIKSEDQILDESFRKEVIANINSTWNMERKKQFKKRYDIYKDKTKRYIADQLRAEGLKEATITQMLNRGSNISICRKVVNKLARTYSGGVTRVAFTAGSTEVNQDLNEYLDQVEKLLDMDDRLKKSDRYRELHKNGAISIIPEIDSEDPLLRKKLIMRALNPWQYDVLPDFFDEEKAAVFIGSEFEESASSSSRSEADAGRHDTNKSFHNPSGSRPDSKDQRYIWWSNKYHFVTDGNGKIVKAANAEGTNPIGTLPFLVNSEEQDGEFWAEGGDDLIDGSILINMLLTDMFNIATKQGYGVPMMTGKNLPETVTYGTNNAIMASYDPAKEEPQPTLEFISANPPLESWMKMIEQYTALLLTTNNLSPGNISTNLSAQQFPSGIAMMVEMSEATNDTEDKQKDYQKLERKMWGIIAAWLQLKSDFNDEWQAIDFPPPENLDVSVKFNEIKPVITEKEKLENLRLRKELGIDSQLDIIQKDNPDMTREQAEQKLKDILEEKLVAMSRFVQNNPQESDEDDDGSEG